MLSIEIMEFMMMNMGTLIAVVATRNMQLLEWLMGQEMEEKVI
jgi:hypothetical protein